ncbi:MFS transporter [Pseudonocardia aurantiaca]|uniref:MFS transporter n=1 Tax=Pseudonocardia aurantiaca TaxID=75290 RepID=A0ABW4FNW7_9PSEU
MLAGLGAAGLWFYTQGLFFGPVSKAFGVPTSEITIVGLYAVPLALACAYPFGRLVDHVGPKRVAIFGIPLFAACIAACALYRGPFWGFQAILVATTVLGVGAGPTIYTRIASAHFVLARGKALGFTLAGLGLAGLVLPPPLTLIIQSGGYRAGYATLAGLALLALPLVLLLVRSDRAGDPGHGQDDKGEPGAASSARETAGWDAWPALRSPTYLVMVALFMVSCIGTTAIFVQLSPILQSHGQSPLQAASAVSLAGLGVIIGRAGVGALMDRFFPTLIAVVLFLVTAAAVSLLLVPAASGLWLISAFAAGLALGAEGDTVAMLVAKYFGLRSYGQLYAVGYALFGPVGASVGPYLTSAQFERTGSYTSAVITSIVLLVLSSLLALALPRHSLEPRRNKIVAANHRTDAALADSG